MATNPKNPAAAASATGTKTYTVKYVVNHDNEEYPVGSPIDLTDKQAGPLLIVDAVVPTDTADGEAA